jgi:hypothetical protein
MGEWEGAMSDDRLMGEIRRLQVLLAEASQVVGRIGEMCRSSGAGALDAALSDQLMAVKKLTASVVRRRSSPPEAAVVPVARRDIVAVSAEDRARALSAEISRESRTLSVSLRGELELTARVAWWAGRARGLLREFADGDWRMRDLVERVLSDLFELARRYDLEGIEALDRRWSIDDFGIYCEYQRHLCEGTPLELSEHEQQILWNALARALLLPGRPVSGAKASRVLSAAAASLGSDHPLVAEVRVHYADRLSRASKSSPPPPSSRGAPPSVRSPESTRGTSASGAPASTRAPESSRGPASRPSVSSAVAVTRGRRAFLVGGSYAHPNQQSEIQQQFKFSKFKWLTATSGSPDSLARLAAAIGPGAYDVAFLLPDAEIGELRGLVDACEAAEIPIVRLPSDYDEDSFANAAAGFFS